METSHRHAPSFPDGARAAVICTWHSWEFVLIVRWCGFCVKKRSVKRQMKRTYRCCFKTTSCLCSAGAVRWCVLVMLWVEMSGGLTWRPPSVVNWPGIFEEKTGSNMCACYKCNCISCNNGNDADSSRTVALLEPSLIHWLAQEHFSMEVLVVWLKRCHLNALKSSNGLSKLQERLKVFACACPQ